MTVETVPRAETFRLETSADTGISPSTLGV